MYISILLDLFFVFFFFPLPMLYLELELTSLIAHLIKNLPAMQETWVRSLGWEDPLEKEMATHSGILPGKSHGQRAWWATVHGSQRAGHD